MEAIADAGEIGISPALAALLDPACVGPAEGRRSCSLGARPRSSASARPDVGDVEALDIASCIPVAARAHVLLRKSEPEHRTITAAFIDMMDTDRLLARARARRARRWPSTSGCGRSRRRPSATRCPSTRPTSASRASRRC